MESEILRQLKSQFPERASQERQLEELVTNFGLLSNSEIKFIVGDILCLAKILYDSGAKNVVQETQIKILQLRMGDEGNREFLKKLEYLEKCLTNFKPAIFDNIATHFAEVYHIPAEFVTCLPKVSGQQVGTKVEVKKTPEDDHPIYFHVKTHQEFCSKSHSNFLAITSDGTGYVNFKELFIYKVLEHLGVGPKTLFIIDKDLAHCRVEESILIATQDLGYTKRPAERKKSFRIFSEVRDDLSTQPMTDINVATRRDIVIIDMLSRIFLLEDVMINQGNFGMVMSQATDDVDASAKIKWKILDFLPPKRELGRGDDYTYGRHYPGGVNIFHSFKIGNVSHTYDREGLEIIGTILAEENARDMWLPALEQLTQRGGAASTQISVPDAMEIAFGEVMRFMEENRERLQIKPERFARRMEDLDLYRNSVLRNFAEMEDGIKKELGAARPTSPRMGPVT